MIRVSVIIPVYNDRERLKLCLDALSQQTLQREEYEVIVVDNLSDPPLDDAVEPYEGCHYLRETTPGSYIARNTGIEQAKGDIFAFTDSDCIPVPEWLERGIAALTEHAPDGSIGGGIELFPADPDHPTSVELYEIVFGLNQLTNVNNFNFAATANMFTMRSTIEAVGPFDVELKSGGDMNWGHRVHAAGRPVVYAADALIRHPARDRLKQILTQARRHAGGRHDLGKQRQGDATKRQSKALGKLGALWRKLCPPFKRLGIARRMLKERGYGLFPWLRVCAVVLTVQYVHIFEHARLALGGKAEKR
jgi:glycosyltransferase involved in cell wall biosynthesis